MSPRTKDLTLDAFVEALTPEERAAWERLIALLADPTTDPKTLWGTFTACLLYTAPSPRDS